MPLTTLDPHCALIVIDLQKGLLAYPLPEPLERIAERAGALAEAFRAANQPVVLVNVDGVPPGRNEAGRFSGAFPPDFAEFLPQLGQQPQDLVATKQTPGAFSVASLAPDLKARGVTQTVICGVATSIGVEATARQAYELGFNVAFAIDAMADLSPESHAHSIERIFPRLGERGTCEEIAALLAKAPR